MSYSRNAFLGSCIGIGVLAGCSPAPKPENIAPVQTGGAYQAQYRMPPKRREAEPALISRNMNAQKCRRGGNVGEARPFAAPAILRGERLSRNDLVDVRVADDDTFNGDYVVSRDGTLKLPFLPPIPAQGRSPEAVEAEMAAVLIREGFYDDAPRISVRLADFAGVSVAVSGAVFEAHATRVGGRKGDDIDTARQAALGASTEARDLSVALRCVRPGGCVRMRICLQLSCTEAGASTFWTCAAFLRDARPWMSCFWQGTRFRFPAAPVSRMR